MLYLSIGAPDAATAEALLSSVHVPTSHALVRAAGVLGEHGVPREPDDWVRGLTFESLGFVDADYLHDGWQAGFNLSPASHGIPDDAALAVSGGAGVTLRACRFELLGGGGVHITNGSRAVRVLESRFHRIGETAVLLTGNATTQPRDCTVDGNMIATVGTQLASAAGVFCSACSETRITGNTIVGSPRWGIAVRSESDGATPADSQRNTIERNRLRMLGQGTRDLGGISLIGYVGGPNTGTRIAHNCVRDVLGVYAEKDGELTMG